MLKQNKITLIIGSIIILLPMLAALVLWNKLPEQIPIHWDAAGQIDSYGGKLQAFIVMPLVMLALQWFCVLFSFLDKGNRNQNRKPISLVLWILPCICTMVQALMFSAALGYAPDVTLWFCLLFGVMFILIGNYLPKCKQNRTLGIKIKWTLQSEENWNATHRFGGKVWVIGGFAFFLCLLLPSHLRFIPVLPLIFLLIALPTIYSYAYYKKHK